VRAAAIPCARNTPYAGAQILDMHARGGAVHAIQIEFDRTLYLDPAGDLPGDGVRATAQLLRAIIDAVEAEATGARSLSHPIAAE
jgi:N-formylglutamate amidohydrolase